MKKSDWKDLAQLRGAQLEVWRSRGRRAEAAEFALRKKVEAAEVLCEKSGRAIVVIGCIDCPSFVPPPIGIHLVYATVASCRIKGRLVEAGEDASGCPLDKGPVTISFKPSYYDKCPTK